MELPGLDFDIGKKFSEEVRARHLCRVSPSAGSSSFLLLIAFGRCKFKLSDASVGQTVGVILQSVLGASFFLWNSNGLAAARRASTFRQEQVSRWVQVRHHKPSAQAVRSNVRSRLSQSFAQAVRSVDRSRRPQSVAHVVRSNDRYDHRQSQSFAVRPVDSRHVPKSRRPPVSCPCPPPASCLRQAPPRPPAGGSTSTPRRLGSSAPRPPPRPPPPDPRRQAAPLQQGAAAQATARRARPPAASRRRPAGLPAVRAPGLGSLLAPGLLPARRGDTPAPSLLGCSPAPSLQCSPSPPDLRLDCTIKIREIAGLIYLVLAVLLLDLLLLELKQLMNKNEDIASEWHFPMDSWIAMFHSDDEEVVDGLQYIDKFYLVDSAYGNIPGFLAPYRNTRYHLQHFQYGHKPETMEELAFGQLKNKFRILKSIPNYGLRKANRIVVTCMALHDFIKDNGGDSGGDWTETSIRTGNNEDGIAQDLLDLMEDA
ncbi:hypothetical protein U9M48_042107, partial [Paspalum notatum var. saurae]